MDLHSNHTNLGRNQKVCPFVGAGVAQLVSARSSKQGVPGSILGDSSVCFDFSLIYVTLASNTRKTKH